MKVAIILIALAASIPLLAPVPGADPIVMVREIARSADLDPDTMLWAGSPALHTWAAADSGDSSDVAYSCFSPDSAWRVDMRELREDERTGDLESFRMILSNSRRTVFRMVALNGVEAVFSPSSTHLLVCGYDGSPVLWDLRTMEPVNLTSIRTPYVTVRDWTLDGSILELYTRSNWEGDPVNPGIWSVEIVN